MFFFNFKLYEQYRLLSDSVAKALTLVVGEKASETA